MGACGSAGDMWGGQAYGIDRNMWQGWGHMVGWGGMWQGVGTCGKDGGRVWGHVTGGGGMWYGVRPIA